MLEGVYGKWELVAKDEVIKKVVKDLVTTDKVCYQIKKYSTNSIWVMRA